MKPQKLSGTVTRAVNCGAGQDDFYIEVGSQGFQKLRVSPEQAKTIKLNEWTQVSVTESTDGELNVI